MNRSNAARWALPLFACAVLLLPGNASAEPPQVDPVAIARDTQRMDVRGDQLVLVWWIPEDYWRSALPQSGMSQEHIEEILQALRPYLLLGVVKGTTSSLGTVAYETEPEVRRAFTIIDPEGKIYPPLAGQEIDEKARDFLSAFRPAIAELLGPLGESLYFYVFPAKNAAGKAITDTRAEGKLVAKLAEKTYEWRTPFDSLVPQKMCPEDKEMVSGAWTYCPWHGTKLVPAGQP
jgi:hypothetical protein